jgi:hypothetical protein
MCVCGGGAQLDVWGGDGGAKRLGTLEIEHSVRKQIIILTVEVSKL